MDQQSGSEPTPAAGCVEVPLTCGRVAIIDAVDAERVLAHRWQLHRKTDGLFYAKRKTTIFLHQMICPAPPGISIDHVDGDGLNCRRANLRHATSTQQRGNSGGSRLRKSRFKGVSLDGGGWRAEVMVNGRKIRRSAKTELEAAKLYNDLAREHFGEFARLNVIEAPIATALGRCFYCGAPLTDPVVHRRGATGGYLYLHDRCVDGFVVRLYRDFHPSRRLHEIREKSNGVTS